MAALQDKRADAWASPKQCHQYVHRYACQYATKFRAEMQRDESRERTVLPKKEPSNRNSMPAKHAKDEEARSVLPRGSVIQQNTTKLASIATRSTVAQTANPVSDGSSLLQRLTSTATKLTETSDPVADGRSLQQWPSIQGKYWLELQRVQHSIPTDP